MDTSNVRHPSRRGVSFGDTSIHGLAVADVETANSQNHNNNIVFMWQQDSLLQKKIIFIS